MVIFPLNSQKCEQTPTAGDIANKTSISEFHNMPH